jgi:hypothetical protein
MMQSFIHPANQEISGLLRNASPETIKIWLLEVEELGTLWNSFKQFIIYVIGDELAARGLHVACRASWVTG